MDTRKTTDELLLVIISSLLIRASVALVYSYWQSGRFNVIFCEAEIGCLS